MTGLSTVFDIVSGYPLELAKNNFAEVWQTRKTRRFERFLSQLQTELDRMAEEQRSKLNDYIETEEAQDRLIEFADSVLSSSDKRVHIALALLYANDRDYPLSDIEIHTFCMAVRNIHPDLITFYLKLEKTVSSRVFDTMPERYTLKHTDLDLLFESEYGSDEVIEMVSELIGLKLLLADPVKDSFAENAGEQVSWGMNESKWTMLRLIKKSEYIIKENIAKHL
jgi:molybdopterin/thiamine biosynthesis adenylyltransferase